MKPQEAKCRLRVGTSGYSYTEWVEAGFYPEKTPSAGMLAYYAERFSATELNYTWYQMPKAEALERMRGRVGPGFLFAAKLTRTMTHEVDPKGWRAEVRRYRDGIAPLVQAGQLAAVLVQLPPSFDRSVPNRQYLAALLDELKGLPVAVEFRNASWANDRVYEGLFRRGAALAAVDVPELSRLFPPVLVMTHPQFFYIRFHGRNAAGWRTGNMQKQFDYDYTEEELKEWVAPKILDAADKAETGFLFFNNHVRAQAPKNAMTMIRLLKDAGLTVG